MRKKLCILAIPIVVTLLVFVYSGYAEDSDGHGKILPLRYGLTYVYEVTLYDDGGNQIGDSWDQTITVSGVVAMRGFENYYVVENHGYDQECDHDVLLLRATKNEMYQYAGNQEELLEFQIGELGTWWPQVDSCDHVMRRKVIVGVNETVMAGGVEYDGCIILANLCEECGFNLCTLVAIKPGFGTVGEIDYCLKDQPSNYAVHELVDVVGSE